MSRRGTMSTVMTVRGTPELDRRLTREARRRRRTRSEVAREILEAQLLAPAADPAIEARRQSLLVRERDSERDALAFVEKAGDPRGWR